VKLLICSDGSEAAARAVRLGAAVAEACRAEVTLLAITEMSAEVEQIGEMLQGTQRLFAERKIPARLITRDGDPIHEIIQESESGTFDLVVVGAAEKGSRGRFWRSSKTYKIIKSIRPPVLAVMGELTTIKQILLCTGGKKYIDNAVALTGCIAHGMGARVTLFHVLAAPPAIYQRLYEQEVDVEAVLNSRSELGRNLREQKATLEGLGVRVEVKLRKGLVLDEIFREINAGNYDLLVSGSSLSRGRLQTYVLGEVTREIVNRARCAVLVARAAGKSETVTASLRAWLDRVTRRGVRGEKVVREE